jgi:hypothetical protein
MRQNSSHLRLPQPGGPGPRIYIPQEHGGPVIPPDVGFPFCRLLRLPRLRWRYSNPPPHGYAMYCANHTEHTKSVRTSQETYYVSATKKLMLFREAVAVYCENNTEHTNSVRTSQETHYFSDTKTNLLGLFREIAAVCCENHKEHTNKLCGQIAEFWYVKADGAYSNRWAL